MKKIIEKETGQSFSNKKDLQNKLTVKFNDDKDFENNLKKSHNIFFNSKKLKEKAKPQIINESDLILKNEELKQEFLNQNNFTIEVDKKRKLKLDTLNSNSTNKYPISMFYRNPYENESRRLMIELVK